MKASTIRFIACLMSFLLLLAGCTSSPPSSDNPSGNPSDNLSENPPANDPVNPQPPQPVKITYWHTYGDAEDEFFKESVLPLLKTRHPEIEVESVRQDGGQFHQMIVMAFGTGQVPDVARVDIVNTASYAAQGGIAAMDELPGFDALKNSVLSGPLSTNLFKSKYYGLPLNTNCKAA
ncbi:MAG: extracellular solute-binding protein, partial [Oscillospiraceae bacterium]|nr:extracellular solute-binding protein [Oscillospiraceae bacterium]